MIYAVDKIVQSTRVISFRCLNKSKTRSFGGICPASDPENEKNFESILWEEAKPFNEIPGPKPLPVIGNTHRFLPFIGEYYDSEKKDKNIFLRKIFEEFGNLVRLSGLPGQTDQLFVFDPKHAEKVYRNAGQWPSRDPMKSLSRYRKVLRRDAYDGVYGLLTTGGEKWWKCRSVLNKVLLRPQVVRLYVDAVNKVADDFVKRMRLIRDENDEMPENFANELNRWALESIGVIALDTRFGCLDENLSPDSEAQRLINSVLAWFELWYQLEGKPSLHHWIDTEHWKQFVTTLDYFNEIARKYIDEAAVRIEKNPKTDEENRSVFEKLISIDKRIAYVMVLDMFQAGIDTTSQAVANNLYYLAKNPDKQEILRKELTEFAPDGNMNSENIGRMQYLKACIRESFRISPILYTNQRTMPKDIVIDGYQVPKKTSVVICHMAMTTNPEIFPEPMKYVPERWLRSSPHFSDAHKFALMPFGHGARLCIGSRFAELEIESLLTKIITNFDVSWHHEDMEFTTKIIYVPKNPLRYRMNDLQGTS